MMKTNGQAQQFNSLAAFVQDFSLAISSAYNKVILKIFKQRHSNI